MIIYERDNMSAIAYAVSIGLAPRNPTMDYPVSRDWKDIDCRAVSCVNNRDNKCLIPSLAVINGNGLSDSRNGLNKLFDLVIEKKINKVVIENKDRLTRFQFNVLLRFFESYDVEVECTEKAETSDEQDLVNDIMMLMASFSGKLYGKRSAKRRKGKKLEKKT